MTQETATQTPDSDPDASTMALRSSTELETVPAERGPGPVKSAPSASSFAPPIAPQPVSFGALTSYDTALPAAVALPRQLVAAPPPEITWSLATLALAGGVGWLYERRRRLELELGPGWRHSPTAGATHRRAYTTGLPETFPEDSGLVEAGRPVYVSVIGDTPSRREATLVDLHDLNTRLRNTGRNLQACAELLEQHLVDFRYSSPWVFLELRELYKKLDQREEWELVRDAFRNRFGQNAPLWDAPSTADAEIANDRQLAGDLVRKWPQRETRMFILRWMLGDAVSRQKCSGPPQLALGLYRDMLLLDTVLDDVMSSKPAAPPVPATSA